MLPLAQALPGVLATLLRSGPMSPGKIELAWKVAAGPAIARATRVRLDGATLVVDTDSPGWTAELRRSSPVLRRRLNALLGGDPVQEIVVRA